MGQDELRIVRDVAIAMVLGGVIGIEREAARKPAGFRTHMLVAGAAALLVELGRVLTVEFSSRTTPGALSVDPIRIIQAVIVGVSFLGAGTIFRSDRGDVHGLTTAASLLMSSGIGVAVAVDRIVAAIAVVALVALVLGLLGWVEDRVERKADT
jgi:putative Mg2+ transporter-C (MgtC) family protein